MPKTHNSKRNRRILIAAVAIFLVAMSILAYIGSLHQTAQPIQIKDANTYFAFSDIGGQYEVDNRSWVMGDPIPSLVFLTTFDFTFTPIEGEVSNVRIFMQGDADPTNTWWTNTIRNGTSTDAGHGSGIMLPYAIPVMRVSSGPHVGTYPFNVTILSNQADGNITFYLTSNELFFEGYTGT